MHGLETSTAETSPPSKGTITWLRTFRVSGIALFDLISAWVIVAWLLRKYVSVLAALPLSILIGIIAHWLFGIKTTLNQKIGNLFK